VRFHWRKSFPPFLHLHYAKMGNMMTSPPEGGEQDPQLRPILRWACAAFGLAYPHAAKRRGAPQAMPAASWSRLVALDAACGR
jgi:hypothetical protein